MIRVGADMLRQRAGPPRGGRIQWPRRSTASTGIDAQSISQWWIELGFLAEPMGDPAVGQLLPPEMMDTIAAHFAAAEGDVQAAISGGARLLVSPVSHVYFDRPLAEESVD